MAKYSELLQEVSANKKIPFDRLLNDPCIGFMRQTQQLCVVIQAHRCRRSRLRLDQHNFTEDLLRPNHLTNIKHPYISQLTTYRQPIPYDLIDLFA